jgi:hypothetical protein
MKSVKRIDVFAFADPDEVLFVGELLEQSGQQIDSDSWLYIDLYKTSEGDFVIAGALYRKRGGDVFEAIRITGEQRALYVYTQAVERGCMPSLLCENAQNLSIEAA